MKDALIYHRETGDRTLHSYEYVYGLSHSYEYPTHIIICTVRVDRLVGCCEAREAVSQNMIEEMAA